MKSARCAASIFLMVGAQISVGHSQPASDAERFHQRFKTALETENRNDVADLFHYPLHVRVIGLNSRLVFVKDAAAMVAMYPLFFGPQFRCAIGERQTVGAGVISMGGGKVIAQRIMGTFKVTRLTVALEAPRRQKPPSMVAFTSSKAERQFSGRLAYNEIDSYLVSALARQRLHARLERFPGRALSIKVFTHRTDQALKGPASEYARVWRALIPDDGQYRVEIHRQLHYCGPEVTYLLTLALQ